jgi:dolichol-phosphate mannosyltransferase
MIQQGISRVQQERTVNGLTLVVVPTYNEVDNVRPLVDGIRRHAPGAHVLFVDDNSQDGTRDGIASLMSTFPGEVHLLQRERKLGLGTAYVAGFKWGLARGYAALVEMDADLSHRAEDLARLVAELRTRPVVVGSRYVPGGGTENWGVGRKIISRAGSFYAGAILRMRVRDLTGGFNGWRRDVLLTIDPDTIRSEGYTFQIELKFRAHLAGFPVFELPILFVERRAGQSKMSSRIVFEAMYRVWHLRAMRERLRRALGPRPDAA